MRLASDLPVPFTPNSTGLDIWTSGEKAMHRNNISDKILQKIQRTPTYIDVFHKWRLWHGNEARMLFSQSILVSNYQTDMISFLAFLLLSIRVSF